MHIRGVCQLDRYVDESDGVGAARWCLRWSSVEQQWRVWRIQWRRRIWWIADWTACCRVHWCCEWAEICWGGAGGGGCCCYVCVVDAEVDVMIWAGNKDRDRDRDMDKEA